MSLNHTHSKPGEQVATMGLLFQREDISWGLRGDPFLWEEMARMLTEEPLPSNLTLLMALINRSFEQLVGVSLNSPRKSVYVPRYDHGGVSGGHVCLKFWNTEIVPEIQRKYLTYVTSFSTTFVNPSKQLTTEFSMKGPRYIDKPCRYEFYPEGCRFGTSCRFRHSGTIRRDHSKFPTAGRNTLAASPNEDTSFLHGDATRDLLAKASNSSFTLDNPKSSVGSSPNSIFSRLPQYHSNMAASTFPVYSSNEAFCPQFARGNCLLGNNCRFKHL
jgi:hypothetical protein